MIPDAAFLRFFETTFQHALEQTEIPGMPDASWDRKAAYLLWRATDGGRFVLAPSEPPPPPEPAKASIFD